VARRFQQARSAVRTPRGAAHTLAVNFVTATFQRGGLASHLLEAKRHTRMHSPTSSSSDDDGEIVFKAPKSCKKIALLVQKQAENIPPPAAAAKSVAKSSVRKSRRKTVLIRHKPVIDSDADTPEPSPKKQRRWCVGDGGRDGDEQHVRPAVTDYKAMYEQTATRLAAAEREIVMLRERLQAHGAGLVAAKPAVVPAVPAAPALAAGQGAVAASASTPLRAMFSGSDFLSTRSKLRSSGKPAAVGKTPVSRQAGSSMKAVLTASMAFRRYHIETSPPQTPEESLGSPGQAQGAFGTPQKSLAFA
jgi:hypothetical protein